MILAKTPILDVKNLRVGFRGRDGATVAVENSSFQLGSGDSLGIVGESGSGKSVTCYALLGLLQTPPAYIESGVADFNGVDLLSCNEKQLRQIRGNKIGMIFQDPMTSLNPYLTIGKQIAEPLIVHKRLNKAAATRRVIELLGEAGIDQPQKRVNQYPHEFSGGMRQRAMIAMALIAEPQLLIADEPTSALDIEIQEQILNLIVDLQRAMNVGLIMISHDLDVIQQVTNYVLVMDKGVVVENGAVDRVLNTPAHAYTQKLIAAIPSGTKPEQYQSKKDVRIPLMELDTVNVRFGEFASVTNASLCLHKGEVLGVVGKSGSGKSTLSRAAVCLQKIISGSVMVEGQNLIDLDKSTLRAKRKDIQMIFQDPFASLNPRFSIYKILGEPLQLHGLVNDERGLRQRLRELMEEVGLSPNWLNKYPHEFSGGQRQRVAIARAIATEPKVIIADEPVSALDVTVQAKILELLLDIVRRRNIGLMFISHDYRVVGYMADRIMRMEDGHIREISKLDAT